MEKKRRNPSGSIESQKLGSFVFLSRKGNKKYNSKSDFSDTGVVSKNFIIENKEIKKREQKGQSL